ncbi:hypothetical protein [Jannaschia sp. R86511]|uniref:hypothetical protein n=1 Tax=Jannaschia sp. R86511 TaxID=3093853 RepID=UPI0036D3B08A
MPAHRSLSTSLLAVTGVMALAVGGLLVGAPPVSAAPRSEVCLDLLEQLDTRYGVTYDPALEAEVRGLVTDHYDTSGALSEQRTLLLPALDEAEFVLGRTAEDLQWSTDRLATRQADVDSAAADVAVAEAELQVAVDGGDPTAVESATLARDQAVAREVDAVGRRDEAAAGTARAQDAAAAAAAELADVHSEVDAIDAEVAELYDGIYALFLERFGDSDYEHLSSVLTAVSRECPADVGNPDGTDGATDEPVVDRVGGPAEADPVDDVDRAPVATPVTTRAPFTG